MKPRYAFLAIVIALIVGMILGSRLRPGTSHDIRAETKTDTVTVRETVTVTTPRYVSVTKVDTMLVHATDTIVIHDTLYIAIPREQLHYSGDSYEAWISGFRPELDSLRIFPDTKYVTRTISSSSSRKRWSIGIQAGYGARIDDGTVRLNPYIGVGLTYKILDF